MLGPILSWILDPSQPPSTRQGSLVVDATGSWQISVSADAVTGGHMAEYDTASSQFVSSGKKLKTSMTVKRAAAHPAAELWGITIKSKKHRPGNSEA